MQTQHQGAHRTLKVVFSEFPRPFMSVFQDFSGPFMFIMVRIIH